MDDTELHVLLGKIGKQIFVQYFLEFGNFDISNQEVIALLPSEYTFKSRTSRTSKSRRIFREGLAERALSIIADSNRLEQDVVIQARTLLMQTRKK